MTISASRRGDRHTWKPCLLTPAAPLSPWSSASTTPDDYAITVGVSDSGAGTYNTNPAKFTLHVLAAPPPSDTTAPTINCTAPDQTVWYANEVTVSCTASDTSGLADPTNDASFSLTTNVGAGNESASAQTNSNQVCDTVSPTPNCATAGPYTFMVDRKAPQLSSCDPADSVWHADNVTLDCHYTDGGSGPATQDVELTTNVAAGDEDDDAAASAGGAQACDAVGNCADSPARHLRQHDRPQGANDYVRLTRADVLLNQSSAYVTGVAVDGGSGPASQNVSAAADTSSVLNNPKSVDPERVRQRGQQRYEVVLSTASSTTGMASSARSRTQLPGIRRRPDSRSRSSSASAGIRD